MMTPEQIGEVVRMLAVDEGFNGYPYDDLTGKKVIAPVGKVTIGIGCNVQDVPLTREEALYLCTNRVVLIEKQLIKYPWFCKLSFLRQYVLLNVAFNIGVPKLLNFDRMIIALEWDDWLTASDELWDSDAARELPNRYAPLREILKTDKLAR